MYYTKRELVKQLKKDRTLYTWENARPEDLYIHALLVKKGYLYSKKHEREHPELCDIVTEKGYEFIHRYEDLENICSCIKSGELNDDTLEIAPYKKYKLYIGSSDVACLTLTGLKQDGVSATVLPFNGDGDYHAWVVADLDLIPSYYMLKECYSFKHIYLTGEEESVKAWLNIYDDDGLVVELEAKEIRVYRAGEFGCLIYIEK
jgi:hypothetical protein